MDQELQQLFKNLTIHLVAACNRNEETINQRIYVQKGA